jgi:hypothetical protein
VIRRKNEKGLKPTIAESQFFPSQIQNKLLFFWITFQNNGERTPRSKKNEWNPEKKVSLAKSFSKIYGESELTFVHRENFDQVISGL